MLVIILASTASSMATVPVGAQATATIRIERPAIASREAWKNSPKSQRRKIIVRDSSGRPIELRLIEYQ